MSSPKYNSFGDELHAGSNLKILKQGRVWFQKNKNSILTSYRYTRDCNSRPHSSIRAAKAFYECEICGKPLWKGGEFSALVDQPVLMIQSKQYLEFMDVEGTPHRVCYKLKECFRTSGFVDDSPIEDVLPVSSLEVLLKDFDSDSGGQELQDALTSTYEKFVLPFILKWKDAEISKLNITEFFLDLKKVDQEWTLYFNPGATQTTAHRRLLASIGVHYE